MNQISFYKMKEQLTIFFCEHRNKKVTRNQLYHIINPGSAGNEFSAVINSLIKENIIYFDDKYYVDKNVYFARLNIKKRGEYYVKIKNKDYKLNMDYSSRVVNGDKILVRVTNYYMYEAEMIGILRHCEKGIAGNIVSPGKFIAKNALWYPSAINVDKTLEIGEATVELEAYEINSLKGLVVSAPEEDEEKTLEQVIIKRNRINPGFSPKALSEAAELNDFIPFGSKVGKPNLTDLSFITIDCEDCKERDDAIYVEKDDMGYHLFIAISDVASVVKPSMIIDSDARKKGCSCYLGNVEYSMLPQRVIDVCSLEPGRERLTLCSEIEVDNNGIVLDSRLYTAIIRSRAALSYPDADLMLEDGTAVLNNMLKDIVDLANKVDIVRKEHGAINTHPKDFLTGSAIESLMIFTNSVVAEMFAREGLPFCYRIQRGIKTELFELIGGEDYSACARIINGASEDEADRYSSIVNSGCLKTIISAEPGPQKLLGVKYYCHFTSPMRNYLDLYTSRLIHRYIAKQYGNYNWQKEIVISTQKLAEEVSYKERQNKRASREYDRVVKMQQLIAEDKDAVYNSVVVFKDDKSVYVNIGSDIRGRVYSGGSVEIGERLPVKFKEVDDNFTFVFEKAA